MDAHGNPLIPDHPNPGLGSLGAPVGDSYTASDLSTSGTWLERLFGSTNTAVQQASDATAQLADPNYYAGIINDFQAKMNSLASTADILTGVLADPSTDAQTLADAQSWMDDFNSRKSEIVLTAQALNAGVATANAAGLSLPSVNVPTQLGVIPLALVALAGTIAAATALAAWALTMIERAYEFQNLSPDAKAKVALANANAQGPLSQLGSIVQWIAIGAAVYFGYKAFTEWNKGKA